MAENSTSGGFNQGQGTGGGYGSSAGGGTSNTGGTSGGSSGGNTGSNIGSSQGLTTTGSQGTGGATGAATAQAEDKGYGAKIAEAASSAKDYVSDKVSAIGDKLADLKNTDIKEVANQAKDYARQNPGQAILISAAAGLVLGLLIRGSRRS